MMKPNKTVEAGVELKLKSKAQHEPPVEDGVEKLGTSSVALKTNNKEKAVTAANSAFFMASCNDASPKTLISISSDSDNGNPQRIKESTPLRLHRQKIGNRPHYLRPRVPRPCHEFFISSDSDDASVTKPLMWHSSYHAAMDSTNKTSSDDSVEAEKGENKEALVHVYVQTMQEGKLKGTKSASIGENATEVASADNIEAIICAFPNITLTSENKKTLPFGGKKKDCKDEDLATLQPREKGDFGDKNLEFHVKAVGTSEKSSLSKEMHGQGLEKVMPKEQHVPRSHKVATSIACNTRSKVATSRAYNTRSKKKHNLS